MGEIGTAKEYCSLAGWRAVMTQDVRTVCSLCSADTAVWRVREQHWGTRLLFWKIVTLLKWRGKTTMSTFGDCNEILNFVGK